MNSSEGHSDLSCTARLFRCSPAGVLGCLLLTSTLAWAQPTVVRLISLPGEYIGQGQTYSTDNEADINVSSTPTNVTFAAIGFIITLAAPGQSALGVGQYSNAVQYPFNGNAPGLNVTGFGRTCTNVCGNFQVFEIQTNAAGQLIHFLATFSQICNCSTPPLTGELRYDSLLAPTNPPPRTLRVPADYPSIQAAIDNANILPAETVLVAPGRYLENINFRGKAVSVISERGPEATIIDGNYNQVPVVTIVSREGSNSVLSGFTIENGFNNTRGGGGSGISIEFSSPTIVGNIFRNNRQGAGPGAAIGCNGASPIIAQNLFIHNPGYGGVIGFFNASLPLIANNVFFDNPGPAIARTSLGCPTVINNTFVSNSVGILLNTAGYEVGCASYVNNIFARNGVAVLVNAGSTINYAPEWSHNLVFGGQGYVGIRDQTGTNGNISADPFFACEPQADFHLLSGSPCIDAGADSSLSPQTDFDGHPRVLAGTTNGSPTVDIGAFEFALSNPPVACPFLFCPSNFIVVAPPGENSALVNYPPPFATPVAVVTNWPPSGSAFPVGVNSVGIMAIYGTNILNCGFTISVLAADDFAQALDTTNIAWAAGGDVPWFLETLVTHDGKIAAQSGSMTTNQTSTLQATVTGPGLLTFWWKVSSETNHDLLSVIVNGSNQAAISGQVDWQQRTIYLGPGTQIVQWKYAKDGSGNAGQDAGWLDQVTWTPGFFSPLITTQPASVSPAAGMNATLSVTADGTPPLSYQWLFNGNALPGATGSSLAITNVQASNVGIYSVIVMNQTGTNYSSNAILRLAEVLAWGANSYGQTNVPVDLTNVAAIAGGWHHSVALKKDGKVLAWGNNNRGQTNVPANLSNVVAIASRSGDHSMALGADGTVIVWGDNSHGQTNVPAGLSNVVAISAGGYRCLALQSDGTAVAWGDSRTVPAGLSNLVAVSAGDFASLFLRSNGTVAATGTTVPASATNIIAIAAGGEHYLGLRTDGTVIAWGGSSQGQTSIPTGLVHVVAIAAGDYHSSALRSDGTVVVWGKYYTGTGFVVPLVPAGLTNVHAIAAGSDHDLALLANASPPFITAQPVSQMVVAGSTVTFSVTAGPLESPLSYQWRFNGTNDISYATNSSLSLSNVQSASAGLYSVRVTNPFGSVLSSNALLRVDHPPLADASATRSPVISVNGLNVAVVLDGSRSSDPDGDPLQYAWFSTPSSQSSSLLASGIVAIVVLPVGVDSITLVVSDGPAASTNSVNVAVLTTTQAVEQLNLLVNESALDHIRRLTGTLEAALASLDRGNPTAAANELQAFQNKVIAQVAPSDPATAQTLIAAAQKVVDALHIGGSGMRATKLDAVKFQVNGKVQLRFSSAAGKTQIVEASTNLVNWQIIGVASEQGDGTFEFEDANAASFTTRFYRVSSP